MSRLIIIEDHSKPRYLFMPWIICSIGALFYCYEYLLRIAPSIMSDDLMRIYHVNAGRYGAAIAFYYYAYTPMQLFVGVLVDRYGPRNLLTLACLSCVIGAFLFSASNILIIAELSRFLIGFGSAFAFVGALKLATIWLPPERFAFISGVVTTLGMIGAMVGDILLVKMVDSIGWRATIVISACIGIVLVIVILLFVHDKVRTYKKIVYSPELSFYEVFVGAWQSLKKRDIWINGIIGCLIYLPLSAFAELWGIPYLMQAHHLSHSQSASAIAMVFFGFAIGGPIIGWLSDCIRIRRLPITIGALFACILISVVLYVQNLSSMNLHLLLLLIGFSLSAQTIVFAIGREVSQEHVAGTAIALTNMFVMMGGALFQPLIGSILDFVKGNRSLVNTVHAYAAHDYKVALSILPIGLFISVILSLFLRETHCNLQ